MATSIRYRERKLIKKYKRTAIIVASVSAVIITAIGGLSAYAYYDMNSRLSEIQTTCDNLESEKNALDQSTQEQIESLMSEKEQLQSLVEEKDSEIEELKEQQTETEPETETEAETINGVKTLSYDQVIDQYDYVMYDSTGSRNDMTEDLVYYGYDLATRFGFNPDLLFGIIMVESEGHANAYNSSTGATGLGQIISTTGSYICKTMMNCDYDHSYSPYVPEINMSIIATYLEYLYKKYDGSTMDVIKEYSGSGSYDQAFSYYMRVCNACGYCID